MLHGLMVVNAFLRTVKFQELYGILLEAARRHQIDLTLKTNAQLSCIVATDAFDASAYDFAIFWDKDVILARQLEMRGLTLFNSSSAILNCDDKSLTYLALKQAGIAIPQTIIAPKTFTMVGYPDLSFADRAAESLGLPIVLKECFGSFGHQVYLLHDREALREKVKELAGTPLLFQRLIAESYGRDARVNVVGGQVVAAILRQSTDGDFRSNLTRGGSMSPYTPSKEEAELAIRATQALGLDFAGVDVLFGKDGPLICEVNSNAHFKTTLECTGVNMADAIMAHIRGKLGR